MRDTRSTGYLSTLILSTCLLCAIETVQDPEAAGISGNISQDTGKQRESSGYPDKPVIHPAHEGNIAGDTFEGEVTGEYDDGTFTGIRN